MVTNSKTKSTHHKEQQKSHKKEIKKKAKMVTTLNKEGKLERRGCFCFWCIQKVLFKKLDKNNLMCIGKIKINSLLSNQ